MDSWQTGTRNICKSAGVFTNITWTIGKQLPGKYETAQEILPINHGQLANCYWDHLYQCREFTNKTWTVSKQLPRTSVTVQGILPITNEELANRYQEHL